MMRYPKNTPTTACRDFRRLRIRTTRDVPHRRAWLDGTGITSSPVRGETSQRPRHPGLRPCEIVHLDLHVGRSRVSLTRGTPSPERRKDIRGPFRAISTTVPGISISEHFPLLAGQAHRLAIVRTMSHDDAAHLSTAHRVLTGHLAPDAVFRRGRAVAARLAAPRRDRLEASADGGRDSQRRQHALDGHASGRARRQGARVSTPAGWARHSIHSMLTVTRMSPGSRCRGSVCPMESPTSACSIADPCSNGWQTLRESAGTAPESWDRHQQQALDALASAEARGAFQVEREDPRLRDRYGRHIHGQCLLLARRLIEAGVGLVTVNWHNDGEFFWDTHGNNFNQLKHRLMPPADQGFSALLDDLELPAACWMKLWSSGLASLAALPESAGGTAAASTGPRATRQSWPAPGCRQAPSTAHPIAWPPIRRGTRSAPKTWVLPSCTRLESTRPRW